MSRNSLLNCTCYCYLKSSGCGKQAIASFKSAFVSSSLANASFSIWSTRCFDSPSSRPIATCVCLPRSATSRAQLSVAPGNCGSRYMHDAHGQGRTARGPQLRHCDLRVGRSIGGFARISCTSFGDRSGSSSYSARPSSSVCAQPQEDVCCRCRSVMRLTARVPHSHTTSHTLLPCSSLTGLVLIHRPNLVGYPSVMSVVTLSCVSLMFQRVTSGTAIVQEEK